MDPVSEIQEGEMLEILRGASCRDLAYDYLRADDEPDPEQTRHELRVAAIEMYGEDEWEHWLAIEHRERVIGGEVS
jgi:uncharacterized protein YcbX